MGKNLTKQQQQAIVLAIMIFGGGGYAYWNYMLKPTMSQIKENKTKYQDLEKKIARAKQQSRRLPALKNQLEKLKDELGDLEKQLPKDKDIPNILRILTREALRENMEFTRLTPAKPIKKNYFEIIPFELAFSGTLHSLARFLASLGQQDRIFKAENIRLNALGTVEGGGPVTLEISLKIMTYAYEG